MKNGRSGGEVLIKKLKTRNYFEIFGRMKNSKVSRIVDARRKQLLQRKSVHHCRFKQRFGDVSISRIRAKKQTRQPSSDKFPAAINKASTAAITYFLYLPNSRIEIDIPVYFQSPLKKQKDESVIPDVLVKKQANDIGSNYDREIVTVKTLIKK